MSAAVSDQTNSRKDVLTRKYTDDSGVAVMSGVQALVRLPLVQMRLDRAAGRRTAGLISGYEGSPLAGYDLELGRAARMLEEQHVVFQAGVNEELAATAIGGSQFVSSRPTANVDGVVGIWYGKAPGLDRASDAIRHGNMQGSDSRGGALLLVGDDPATKSSSLPSASELALIDLGTPTLFPATVHEVVDYGLYAIALSRVSGLWTSLKVVVGVADATASVNLEISESVRTFLRFVEESKTDPKYQHVSTPLFSNPIRLRLEREMFTRRLDIAEEMLRRFRLDTTSGATKDARIGIIASGKTAVDVREALLNLGLDDTRLAEVGVRVMKVGALFPMPSENLREFAAGLSKIIVVEEKRGPLEGAILKALYGSTAAPIVVGKRGEDGTELFPAYGELDVDAIAGGLRRVLADEVGGLREERVPRARVSLPVVSDVSRSLYFCSGCPHSRSTPVPDGSIVGAGIGCHALITRSPRTDLGEVIGFSQMGGEGAQWIGLEPFVSDGHLFQNLGDGTLFHSGTLAIRAAIAAKSHITFKILYNSAAAMTGGQAPIGKLDVPALTKLLAAEGVEKIIVTTADPSRYRRADIARGARVLDDSKLLEAQEELKRTPGVTALIHDQECAAELRRKRKRGTAPTPDTKVLINDRICEGCGDCGEKSNCLSVIPVDTEFGGKTQIHQESCNTDLACLKGHCPSFVTVKAGGAGKLKRAKSVDLDAADLVEPVVHVSDDFTMRVTGIGGTGIVTVAQIVGMAAKLAGRSVVGLDQTGLAQKGGPVVSDLKVSSSPDEQPAKLAKSECDLYLVADLLAAVEPQNLGVVDPGRTTAVISTSKVTPGELVGRPFKSFPEISQLVDQVASVTSPEHLVTLDALMISNRLFHNDVSANLVLLGAAYQSGALPIPASTIEEAIGHNGVAVRDNVQAFRRGRQAVSDPAGLAKALEAAVQKAATPTISAADLALIETVPSRSEALEALLRIRVPDLVAYQDRAYAQRYVALVREARAAELRIGASRSTYSEAVAKYFYKLLAYKDEYEIARLSLEVVDDAYVETALGSTGTASYNLLPPSLTRFGLKRKLRLGPWFRVVFTVLYACRRLRGTSLDPFGRHEVRRLERELIADFGTLVATASSDLDQDSYERAVELATLPDLIRGFDHVKLRNVEVYRSKLAELRSGAGAPAFSGKRSS
ncbi:MAG TPA: indolepyruvate ferredoxin oxidoreductase family protein [Jatrophihabitantaceae bacterium]|nr:indolepyruvate ferredoxin oxidoreductase family protein [Jatrophihabitantaceae bacterium]